MLILAVCI